MLLNILQGSSFSNQITFILHIQGVFSLPGRGFRQRVTLTSSILMTLDDVIVHVRQFIMVKEMTNSVQSIQGIGQHTTTTCWKNRTPQRELTRTGERNDKAESGRRIICVI